MQELKDQVSAKWWIAHSGASIVHHGKAEVGQVVTTGQTTLEQFNTESDWKGRLRNFGIIINKDDPYLPGPI
jgi:hypothetical protein